MLQEPGDFIKVDQLPEDKDYIFVSNTQDVEPIKEMYPNTEDYDSFFVLVGDGEYLEVWGMQGIVPYSWKKLCKVT
jgi:hypothetical protein